MRAMVIANTGPLTPSAPGLVLRDYPLPTPGAGEVRLRVLTCGVCRTDLDEIEGRLAPPSLPRIPGHQIVGVVDECGPDVDTVRTGDRVGVAWFAKSCGQCTFCLSGRENLCPAFVATGHGIDGGYADYVSVPAAAVHPLPGSLSSTDAAPLLCAGAIGHRALRATELSDGEPLGLMGFGASAHVVLQLVQDECPHSPVHVFARGEADRGLAHELGATSVGTIADAPPQPLAAIIDTTPAWMPVVRALQRLQPGGRLVINAIRKDDADKDQLCSLDYARDLWMERSIKTVANVTRADVREFLARAVTARLRPKVTTLPLEAANDAVQSLANGGHAGAFVLVVNYADGD